MIKGTSKRRITEGEAMPRTFISLRFRQFSENSVVNFGMTCDKGRRKK
jgi:hypothetical protein